LLIYSLSLSLKKSICIFGKPRDDFPIFFKKIIDKKNEVSGRKRREKNGQHKKERIDTTFSCFGTQLAEVLGLASKKRRFPAFF